MKHFLNPLALRRTYWSKLINHIKFSGVDSRLEDAIHKVA